MIQIDPDVPFLPSCGLTEDQRRSRVYLHPLRNGPLISHMTQSLQNGIRLGCQLNVEELIETLTGLAMTKQIVPLNEILGTFQIETPLDVFKYITHAQFGKNKNYSDTFFVSSLSMSYGTYGGVLKETII